jgi:pimeloyl-ACP methyl ester carboxylesterase
MADDAAPPPQPKKQAVLLIHGIGEQRPMSTLWRLVDLVWTNAPKPAHAPERRVFSEPDEMSGVFELRRISTNLNADGKRTDFFEYYWAHLMSDNEIGEVIAWLADLAMRPKERVPETLRKAWAMLRITLAVVAGLLALVTLSVFASGIAGLQHTNWVVILVLVTMLLVAAWMDRTFVSPVLGDAARYLRPNPKNTECRQEIRARGLKLLEAIHDSGKYDRIVLVGHSLGGVIAYEMAVHFWGRRNRTMNTTGPVQVALAKAEEAARALQDAQDDTTARDRFRLAQNEMFEALRTTTDADGKPLWLVSDLVTMGSPLTHAPTLLADDPDDFTLMLARHELSACPPQFETFQGKVRRFSYCRRPDKADDPTATPRAPHNAAVFAAVRWTNLYFPMQGILRGDLIGGPVGKAFGPGTKDVAVRAPRPGGWLPHMDYFNGETGPLWGEPGWQDHRQALREAMALEAAAAPVAPP